MDLVYPLNAQRRKRAQPNVQRHARDLNATCCERLQSLWREVQPRGRRSHRAAFAREHRLVAFAIGRGIVAADVGWKRNMTDSLEHGEKIAHRPELDQPLAELSALQNFSFKLDGAR